MSVTFVGVGWFEASVGGASVNSGHSSGSYGTFDVELSSDGGGSDMEETRGMKSINIEWRNLRNFTFRGAKNAIFSIFSQCF